LNTFTRISYWAWRCSERVCHYQSVAYWQV
jgi:hypothetical protein